ncbi:MAG: hypothetical protein OEM85_17705 [Gammaproteobacteria bacterium]|nr:hypothetical protein [Gammaproteobacteria bacterium]MDH3375198.1 hypothetical protein [Gammaproteobacteria bacterium]
MKRFHVHVSVAHLEQSIEFYRTLFGEDPAVLKHDYVKSMLEDPRINFSLSKTWVRDPDSVAWETFVTHADTTHYGDDRVLKQGSKPKQKSRRCA